MVCWRSERISICRRRGVISNKLLRCIGALKGGCGKEMGVDVNIMLWEGYGLRREGICVIDGWNRNVLDLFMRRIYALAVRGL